MPDWLGTEYQVVFVDGEPALDRWRAPEIEGVVCKPIASAIADGDLAASDVREYAAPDEAFAAINSARFSGGVYLFIPSGCRIEGTLALIDVRSDGSAGAVHQRHHIQLADQASASIAEVSIAAGDASAGLVTSVADVVLGKGAALHQIRWQSLHSNHHRIRRQHATISSQAELSIVGIDVGGGLVRNDEIVRFEGEDGSADLQGLYVADGEQHIDNHLVIDHASRDCSSNQNYRGILSGRSRGVFNGKVVVQPGADGTGAEQSNANLLLSSNAEIDTKPELEIYADDVTCSHGATVGQLDESAMFYLQSRGIEKVRAQAMLTAGFAATVLESVGDTAIRGGLTQHLDEKLEQIGMNGEPR